MKNKEIKIACVGAAALSIELMHPLQEGFKVLEQENYEKLKNQILDEGFSAPIFVWEDPTDAKIKILDGHQRYQTLTTMRDEEDYQIPQIPVVYIEAEDVQQAVRKLAGFASQYGTVIEGGFQNLMKKYKIDLSNLNTKVRIPTIDLAKTLESVQQLTKSESAQTSLVSTEEAAKVTYFSIFTKDEIVQDAFEYFRENGFPFPYLELHEQKQELNKLAEMNGDQLLKSRAGYRIADSYHQHRFKAAAQDMSSPFDSFNIDKRLKKAIDWHLSSKAALGTDFFGTLSLVNGTQACSNFRPAFAKYLYNKYCKEGGIVFDSSTGYGGRLTGFLASHCKTYIGTDPNTLTFNANKRLAIALGKHKTVTLFNDPVEDLNVTNLVGRCDFAFTSPPYFSKELYSDEETQSWKRYGDNYAKWVVGFLKPMLEKQFAVLKKGATNIVNIEDVTIKETTYPLVQDTIDIGVSIGFKFLRVDRFELSNRTYVEDGQTITEDASEAVIVFEK